MFHLKEQSFVSLSESTESFFFEDYQECMNGKNESLVSKIPPRGNLAMERVRLVIGCHLVKERGKRKENFTFVRGVGRTGERPGTRTRDVQLRLAVYHHYFKTHRLDPLLSCFIPL